MRLLVVRHGATLNNAEARYTGQSDAGLSTLGERQAGALATRLATERLDVIVTSDLRRARQTADQIARHHAIPMYEDADLREIAMGDWEGQTFADVMERNPSLAGQWSADPITVAPPRGETYTQLRDRLISTLARWSSTYPDSTVLWVTHGGALGVLLCHLLGLDLTHRLQFRRDNAAITEILLGEDYAVLARLNDTAHLSEIATVGLGETTQVL